MGVSEDAKVSQAVREGKQTLNEHSGDMLHEGILITAIQSCQQVLGYKKLPKLQNYPTLAPTSSSKKQINTPLCLVIYGEVEISRNFTVFF